jgi:hypothetical protein
MSLTEDHTPDYLPAWQVRFLTGRSILPLGFLNSSTLDGKCYIFGEQD